MSRERFEHWFTKEFPGTSLYGVTGQDEWRKWQIAWNACAITALEFAIELIPSIGVAA